jgi:hypothetical protein
MAKSTVFETIENRCHDLLSVSSLRRRVKLDINIAYLTTDITLPEAISRRSHRRACETLSETENRHSAS